MTETKVETLSDVRGLLEKYNPVDFYETHADLKFESDEDTNVLVSNNTHNIYRLNAHSFSQYLHLLHRNASRELVEAFSPMTKIKMVTELQGKVHPKKRYLIRNTREMIGNDHLTVGVLTTDYKPVSSVSLVDTLDELGLGDFKGYRLHVDWDLASLRIPIKQVANHGKGIFFGVQIQNGMTGKYALNIKALIWELICSNGATRITKSDTFVSQKHLGDLNIKMSYFKEWANSSYLNVKNDTEKLLSTKVAGFRKFVTAVLPQKYKDVTNELASMMYSYANSSDKVINDTGTAWDVVRSLTYTSQNFNAERRYHLDTVASKIAKEEWNIG